MQPQAGGPCTGQAPCVAQPASLPLQRSPGTPAPGAGQLAQGLHTFSALLKAQGMSAGHATGVPGGQAGILGRICSAPRAQGLREPSHWGMPQAAQPSGMSTSREGQGAGLSVRGVPDVAPGGSGTPWWAAGAREGEGAGQSVSGTPGVASKGSKGKRQVLQGLREKGGEASLRCTSGKALLGARVAQGTRHLRATLGQGIRGNDFFLRALTAPVGQSSQALTVLNAGKRGVVGYGRKGSASKVRPKVAFDSGLEGAKGGQALPVGLLEWSAVLEEGGEEEKGKWEQAQRELLSKIADFIYRMREAQGVLFVLSSATTYCTALISTWCQGLPTSRTSNAKIEVRCFSLVSTTMCTSDQYSTVADRSCEYRIVSHFILPATHCHPFPLLDSRGSGWLLFQCTTAPSSQLQSALILY